jgi:hypothetical protein
MEPSLMIDSFSGASGDTGRPQTACDRCTPLLAQITPNTGRHGYDAKDVESCPTSACDRIRISTREMQAATGFDANMAAARIGGRTRPLSAKTLDRLTQSLARYTRTPVPAAGADWADVAGPASRTGLPAKPRPADNGAAQHPDTPQLTTPALPSPTYAGLLPEHARVQAEPSDTAGPDLLWSSPSIPALWFTTATRSSGTSPKPAAVSDTPVRDGADLTGTDVHSAVPIIPGGVAEPVVPMTRWTLNHWALHEGRTAR